MRRPRPDTVLVSHGWRKRCPICERQTHAKWHEYAQGEINPVALIELIESFGGGEDMRRLVRWVIGVTGIDEAQMRAALADEAKR